MSWLKRGGRQHPAVAEKKFAFRQCPGCSDPPTCKWSVEGFAHAENARAFFRA